MSANPSEMPREAAIARGRWIMMAGASDSLGGAARFSHMADPAGSVCQEGLASDFQHAYPPAISRSADPGVLMTDELTSRFVLPPIGEPDSDVRRAADQTLKHLIKKALPSPRFEVLRGDEDTNPGATTPLRSSIVPSGCVPSP